MLNLKTYLAGAMKNLSREEYLAWRIKASSILNKYAEEREVNLSVVNPAYLYNYEEALHKTDREIDECEMYHVRKSDFIILNLRHVNISVGTITEVVTSYEKGIPVVAFGNAANVHPMILDRCLRVDDTLEDVCRYIRDYLLL